MLTRPNRYTPEGFTLLRYSAFLHFERMSGFSAQSPCCCSFRFLVCLVFVNGWNFIAAFELVENKVRNNNKPHDRLHAPKLMAEIRQPTGR